MMARKDEYLVFGKNDISHHIRKKQMNKNLNKSGQQTESDSNHLNSMFFLFCSFHLGKLLPRVMLLARLQTRERSFSDP